MKKIVFVGQTPPPFHGQAIMIEKILAGPYRTVRLYHVRMAFSKEMDEIGKLSIFKIIHLLAVICKIVYLRVTRNASTLYYPPAGPDKTPIIRDLVILVTTRWLFKRTIFHFHAGGLSEVSFKSGILNRLYALAYYRADCAILLSGLNPPDGSRLHAKKEVIIPYGIEDHSLMFTEPKVSSPIVNILFVAMIKESKGIMVLIEAAHRLKSRGLKAAFQIMGKFESRSFEHIVKHKVREYHLEESITFLGVLTGPEKFRAFRKADIFCFPSFFESETFGVVLLEAMQFSLPVVATRWRGIPSIVDDGKSGFLVEPKDPEHVASRLEELVLDSTLRQRMGAEGRKKFLADFTLQKFIHRMDDIFSTC